MREHILPKGRVLAVQATIEQLGEAFDDARVRWQRRVRLQRRVGTSLIRGGQRRQVGPLYTRWSQLQLPGPAADERK